LVVWLELPLGQLLRFTSRIRSTTLSLQSFPVVLSKRPHPIPSRTRKLSSSEPMVLHGKPCGRVGRRRDFSQAAHQGRLFFCVVMLAGRRFKTCSLFTLDDASKRENAAVPSARADRIGGFLSVSANKTCWVASETARADLGPTERSGGVSPGSLPVRGTIAVGQGLRSGTAAQGL
jgi:hypothetical protein